MDKYYKIVGGKPLNGAIDIGGAKNAMVAIIAATVLAKGKCRLLNVPDISDVNAMVDILVHIGGRIDEFDIKKRVLAVDTSDVDPDVLIPPALAGKCRSSYYLMGALLGAYNRANVALPGGCKFGDRPINLHIDGFRMLGGRCYDVTEETYEEYFSGGRDSDCAPIRPFWSDKDGIMVIRRGDAKPCTNRFGECLITFDKPSVGATINIMLAAVGSDCTTEIRNAAKEPHIVDIAMFLVNLGYDIKGAGTNTIIIKGEPELEHKPSVMHEIIPDQIEAGTYMTAAAIAGGEVTINRITAKHLDTIAMVLSRTGVFIDLVPARDSMTIKSDRKLFSADFSAEPYPGFPTDMQPQMTTVLTLCEGTSNIRDGVWATRFGYVKELERFGADITVISPNEVEVHGVQSLHGAVVNALDLRAGAAMIVAALAAEGTTYIGNIGYIERGYEKLVEKLRSVGADIELIDESDLPPEIAAIYEERKKEEDARNKPC